MLDCAPLSNDCPEKLVGSLCNTIKIFRDLLHAAKPRTTKFLASLSQFADDLSYVSKRCCEVI